MTDLEKRIESAMELYCNNKGAMHVPPRDTDIDVVLSDCLKEINELKQKLARYENPDYVLVPREPTKAMMDAGDEKQDYTWVYVDEIYKAMIEALEIED